MVRMAGARIVRREENSMKAASVVAAAVHESVAEIRRAQSKIRSSRCLKRRLKDQSSNTTAPELKDPAGS